MRKILLSLSVLLISGSSFAKTFLLTLPLVAVDREWAGRAEYNIMKKGGLALELGGQSMGEDLTNREKTENPGRSLFTGAREIRFMVSRYSQGASMSGFYWGAGFGYRQAVASWTEGYGQNYSEEDVPSYVVVLDGQTMNARTGYRFQSELGVMAGVYLGFEHFQPKVRDALQVDGDQRVMESTPEIREKIARKMSDRFRPGFEFGWAF